MDFSFSPLQIEKQAEYTARLARCPQVASDYSFINLWAWAEEFGLRWAWDDDLVWIKQTRPHTRYWAPVGDWQKIDWPARFEANPRDRIVFDRIPEHLMELWRRTLSDSAAIEEDRGNWDYIYAAADLIELKGKRFHKKKNLLNQFKKNYDYRYIPFETEAIEHAMAMQADWCTWRDCESSDILSAENRAIFRVLQQWEQLHRPLGGAIMVAESIVAYTVAEALTADTLLIHFEKGDTEYKGAYQAVNQMFLAHEARDVSYVNREQDLNDEGLRKAKLSYHPVDFLRKYRVVWSGVFHPAV